LELRSSPTGKKLLIILNWFQVSASEIKTRIYCVGMGRESSFNL
jgi:hypothetical protein